jgi:hypothetical protein
MPAQWPLFINNVSSKLASRSSKGADDFGTFMANEYFNAVKTSQTPFGNLHSSGQKAILEQGFKKAFNDLFKSGSPTLLDKLEDPKFNDLLEELPIPKKYDINKELRKCVTSTGPDIKFYEFFPEPVDPNDSKELTSADLFGAPTDPNQIVLTFTGLNGIAPYTFTYKINNGEDLTIISNEFGIAQLFVPRDTPAKLTYTLTNVTDFSSPNINHPLNQIVDVVVPKELEKPVDVVNGPQAKKLVLTEAEQIELVAKRVLYQNDKSASFKRFVQRINNSNINGSIGTQIRNKVLDWLDRGITFESPLSKKVFQFEYDDNKDTLPTWLKKEYICKFIYYPGIDDISSLEHTLSNANKELQRTFAKYPKYEQEKDAYIALRKQCIQNMADNAKKNADDETEEDPYDTMAKTIIQYWMSCTVKPFKNSPPIPPCNIPSPGTYIPIYYGSQKSLAKNLRRAWNTGKLGQLEPTLQPMTKAVASAVAVCCAKHLLELKFIYVGQLTVGAATIPMIGFVPMAF